jgi:hypothetical protein
MEMIKKILSYFKKKPIEYEAVSFAVNNMTEEQINMVKSYKKIFAENQINLNKIRFVFDTSFTYDVDNNLINPEYQTLQPKKKRKNAPVIEINKPQNLMTIYLGENRTFNNVELLKQYVKKSKRGIVILACNEDVEDVMWFTNLDDAADYYFQKQIFEYET